MALMNYVTVIYECLLLNWPGVCIRRLRCSVVRHLLLIAICDRSDVVNGVIVMLQGAWTTTPCYAGMKLMSIWRTTSGQSQTANYSLALISC